MDMTLKRLLVVTLLGTAAYTHLHGQDALSFRIVKEKEWAFYGSDNPKVSLSVSNGKKVPVPYSVKCDIEDFTGKALYDLTQSGTIAPEDSSLLTFSFKAVDPGFYSVAVYNNGKFVNRFNVARNPETQDTAVENYLSAHGGGEDFVYLANLVSLARRDIKPQYVMLRNKQLSGREKNVYDFSMVSTMDEKVTGYVAFPKGKKELPIIITLVPIERKSANPLADFTAPSSYAEMVVYLKSRGDGEQVLRNFLTDMLLSVDFVKQRMEIDNSSIYVQGEGYAGSCAMVVSALDETVAGAFASSPDIGILTDFCTEESLAKGISVPLLLGVGLQDDSFSLQQIFSVYNRAAVVKEYFAVPQSREIERREWKTMRDAFILRLRK